MSLEKVMGPYSLLNQLIRVGISGCCRFQVSHARIQKCSIIHDKVYFWKSLFTNFNRYRYIDLHASSKSLLCRRECASQLLPEVSSRKRGMASPSPPTPLVLAHDSELILDLYREPSVPCVWAALLKLAVVFSYNTCSYS